MLNCAIIMGRLTADPELRTTNNGTSVTSFTVAVDRNFARPGEDRQADFINVVAWRQSAEFVSRYFHKGSMIAVQGSIQTRSYEDKNGNRRTAVEIVADRVSFCGSKNESNTGTTRYDSTPAPTFTSGDDAAQTFSVLPDDDEEDGSGYNYDDGNGEPSLPF